MAITWGSVVGSNGGFQLGVDFSPDSCNVTGNTTVTAIVYIYNTNNVSDSSNTLSINGVLSWSGARSISGTGTREIWRGSFTTATPSPGTSWGTYLHASLNGLDYFGSGNTATVTKSGSWTNPAKVPNTPSTPTISNVTATGIRVTSGIPANNGAGITSYRFRYSLTNSTSGTSSYVDHNGNIRDITGLKPYTTYYCWTHAYNSVGWSAASAIRSVQTLDVAPSAPSSVAAVETGPTTGTVSWAGATTTGTAITNYLVSLWTAASGGTQVGSTQTLAATAREASFTGLTAATNYYAQVIAKNTMNSAASTRALFRTTGAPLAPTNVKAVQTADTGGTLSWTSNPVTGAPITATEIQKRTNGGSWTALTSQGAISDFTYTGTAANQKVEFQVRQQAAGLWGPWSAASAPIFTTPPAPTSVAATASQVTWASTGAYTERRFPVQRSLNGATFAALATPTASPYATAAPANSKVRYQVRAEPTTGGSLVSAWVQTGYVYTAPAAPTNVTFTKAGTDTVTVAWGRGSGYTEANTVIETSINGGAWTVHETTSELTGDRQLTLGQVTAQVRVKHVSTVGALSSAYVTSPSYNLRAAAPIDGYFDGESLNTSMFTYEWTGAANNSPSVMRRVTGNVHDGDTTVNGNLSVSGNVLALSPASSNAGVELGRANGTSTPFIDFHSSGTASDYDSRIIASGGNATAGKGTLKVIAGSTYTFDANGLHQSGAQGTNVGYLTRKDYVDAADTALGARIDVVHRATEIGPNVNLNDVVEPGAYVQSQNAEATTALNYPALPGGSTRAGLLEVYGDGTPGGMKWHRYSCYAGGGETPETRAIFQRSFYSNVWAKWQLVHRVSDWTVHNPDPANWSTGGGGWGSPGWRINGEAIEFRGGTFSRIGGAFTITAAGGLQLMTAPLGYNAGTAYPIGVGYNFGAALNPFMWVWYSGGFHAYGMGVGVTVPTAGRLGIPGFTYYPTELAAS